MGELISVGRKPFPFKRKASVHGLSSDRFSILSENVYEASTKMYSDFVRICGCFAQILPSGTWLAGMVRMIWWLG